MAKPTRKPSVSLNGSVNQLTLTVSTSGTKAARGSTLNYYQILWGDGTSQSANTAPPISMQHSYTLPGLYTVVLSVSQTSGSSATISRNFTMVAPPPDPPPPPPPPPPDTPWGCGTITPGQRVISAPSPAVEISPGTNNIQAVINANVGATTFYLRAGTFHITSSIAPKTGNRFIGEDGAIIDGTGWVTADDTAAAFRSSNTNVSNVLISNLQITNMPQNGIHSANYSQLDTDPARNWTVEYCEISNCVNTGIVIGNFGCKINNCIIHDCTKNAYEIFRHLTSVYLLPCEFSYNEVYNSGNTDGPKAINIQASIWWHHNHFHDNTGVCIWNDGGGSGSIIEYNTLEDSLRGIQWEMSTNCIMRYNIVSGMSDDGIFLSTSGYNNVHHNQILNCFRGIELFVDCSRVGDNEGPYPWDHDLHENTIQYNLITVPASPPSSYGGIFNYTGCPSGTVTATPYSDNTKNNNYDYNTYTTPDLVGTWWYWVGNKTFTTWKAIPQDTNGVNHT